MRALVIPLLLAVACAGGRSDATDETDVLELGELLGIGLSPREPVLNVGEGLTFQVKAFYDSTRTVDITDQVAWVSTNPRVATVDGAGRAVALAPGEADVVATDARGVATRTTLSVKGADDQPTDLALLPRAVEVRVDEQVELTARATYGDGSTGNLAAACEWSSDDPTVAAIDGGIVSGLREGRTTVRAECAGLSAAVPVAVQPADAELDLPDLVVSDYIFDVVGDELQVIVEVRNAGEGMSPVVFVDLFVDPVAPPEPGDEPAELGLIEALAPDESGIALITVPGLSDGDHAFWLVVDGDDQVDEADEDNRSGPHAFSVDTAATAQLVIDAVSATTDGEYTFWTIDIRNAGTATARDFWIDLWYDPSDDPEVCDTGDDFTWVTSLAPGATYRWEPDVDDGPSSSWLSVVYVDSCDDVAESDEDDNIEYAWVEE